MIDFEWDENKAAKNLRDHGIHFSDVSPVFQDGYRITEEDSVHEGELRWRTVGSAANLPILLSVHLEADFDGDLFVRIISARRATAEEREDYEQNRSYDI